MDDWEVWQQRLCIFYLIDWIFGIVLCKPRECWTCDYYLQLADQGHKLQLKEKNIFHDNSILPEHFRLSEKNRKALQEIFWLRRSVSLSNFDAPQNDQNRNDLRSLTNPNRDHQHLKQYSRIATELILDCHSHFIIPHLKFLVRSRS